MINFISSTDPASVLFLSQTANSKWFGVAKGNENNNTIVLHCITKQFILNT